MDVKSSFGENLKFYRRQRKLTQEQLSEKIEVSVKHLSAIERGLNFASAELLERLAATLNVPVFLFFVKEAEIFYTDRMLSAIDTSIEKRLTQVIKDLKSDIRSPARVGPL
jgi:transcriptional regulator with XRE-family HTH domain